MSFNTRRLSVLTLTGLAVLVFGMVTAAFAQDGNNPPPKPKPKQIDTSKGTFPNLRQPNSAAGQVSLLVEFRGKPAAQVYAEHLHAGENKASADDAAAAAVKTNTDEQSAAQDGFRRLGARTLYSVQRVLNASVIQVDARKVRDVMNLPGVARVSYAPRNTIDNAHSVPFIGANKVWDSTGALGSHGLTGKGITVAVIDTGVDYIHKNFGGNGNYTGQDPTVINSDGIAFPTAKVVGGYDFVGDAYDAASSNPALTVPHPDPDPMDCNGHGSHTAGTAAGFGVAGGATYTGGYDNLTDFSGFTVGPGVAPQASVVALKVFGCQGSTDVVVQAIEYATDPNGDGHFDDHYDVINMSLGSDYGYTGEEDAITNATNAGVVVVASAGNAGDNHYIAGSPADVTQAISVAASIGGGQHAWTLHWDNNGDGSIDQDFFAIPQGWAPNPSPDPSTSALLEKPSGNLNGCASGDFSGFTAGNVAYIYRGTCSIKLKAHNAQAAGASAAVIVAHNTNVPVAAADDATVPAVTIPTVMISGDAGDIIEAGTFTGDKASIGTTGGDLSDQIAGFSSRGPRRQNMDGTVILKPDISAPGFNIVSTANGTGDQGVAESGTSMAAPHISGVMALLRQEHPDWTVAQLKALVMNTALHDLFDTNLISGAQEDKVSTSREGAGRVDVPLAADSNVIAYASDNPDAVSVTFQTRDVLEGTTRTEAREVTIENKGTSPVDYKVSTSALENVPGVTIKVSPNKVTVGPGKTAKVRVIATYKASALIHALDPASLEDENGNPRHWITESTGFVVLTGSGNTLRVPYYAAPRPASAMTETTSHGTIFTTGDSGSLSVPLTGLGVYNSNGSTTKHSGYTQDYQSQVSAFQLTDSSPKLAKGPQPFDGGDIQYVGVANDKALGGAGFSFFGMSTWGNWDTPDTRQVYVCLDLNQDHTGGAFGDGTDWCFVTVIDDQTDTQMTGLWDINGFLGGGKGLLLEGWDFQNQAASKYDTRIFDNSVFFMPAETDPALWASYGLASATTSGSPDTSPAFDYYIFTVDNNDPVALAGGITDQTPRLTYDPASAPIHHTTFDPTVFGGGAPITADVAGGSFNFNYDLTSAPDGKVDLLFLHHYNTPEGRAQIVTIDKNAPACTGLDNCDFESANKKHLPNDWFGAALKPGDILTGSPVHHGSNAWMFSGKDGTRSLSQDAERSGSKGAAFDVTFYVDGSGLQPGDSATVTLTFFDGKKSAAAGPFAVTNTMDINAAQTYHMTAPGKFDKVRATLTATLKSNASKVVFDTISLTP